MAEINFLKSFTGTTERDFAQSFEGINYADNSPLLIYLQGYIKAYQKEYEGTYIKQYSGDYIKHYQKEYTGQWHQQYVGDYQKLWLKQYDKQYEKNWSTNWDKAYVGQYTKTYVGEYTHQWTGNYTKEYTGNYDGPQYYGGNTVGQFDKIYEGTYTGYYLEGNYIKLWEGAYEHDWIGVYEKQYEKDYTGYFTKITTVNYTKSYTATWTKQYVASFQGFVNTTRNSAVNYNVETLVLYNKTYEGNWNKNYVGEYNKQWSHQYVKHYQKEYSREWLGLYDHQWHGAYGSGTGYALFHHNYVGYYTGYFDHNYVGYYLAYYIASYVPSIYSKLFTISYAGAVYQGVQGGTFGRPFMPAGTYNGEVYPFPQAARQGFPGLPINYTAGAGNELSEYFQSTSTANFEGFGQNYSGGTGYGTGYFSSQYHTLYEGTTSPGGGPEDYAKTYVKTYLTAWERDVNYTRAYQKTDTVSYEGFWNFGVYIGNNYGGTNYIKNYDKITIDSEPGHYEIFYTTSTNTFTQSYIAGSTTLTYLGAHWSRQYSTSYIQQYNVTDFEGVPTFNKHYESVVNYGRTSFTKINYYSVPGDPPRAQTTTYTGPEVFFGGTVQYTKAYIQQYDRAWERAWSHTTVVAYDKIFVGYTGVQYDGIYEAQYSKQYEGTYVGTYLKHYAKEYEKLYEKTYLGYSIHEWIGYYDKQYEGSVFSIRNSSETYSGGYLHMFDGPSYDKEYDGATRHVNYEHEYEGIYEGYFTKQFSHDYEGIYTKQYLGEYEAVYSKHWEGDYTGQYTKHWEGGPYDIQYEGIYTKQYEGQFDKQYEGTFDKQYEGTYHSQYNSADFITQYSKQYTKEYEKIYQGVYDKVWEGTWNKQYEAGYIQQYSKEYDGIYLKQYEKSYGGAWTGAGPSYEGTAYFTNTYAGTRTFHQTYTGTTTEISNRTGNLSNNIRVKEDGEWKDVSRVRIKDNGVWKIVGSSRVKVGNEWKVVAVDHDRVDIDITSNTANFNIGTELNNLGFTSLYDKPKHINVNIAEGVHVYSTSSTPAIDTTLLTGVSGTNHKIRIVLKSGAKVLGAAGRPGSQDSSIRTGNDGTDGGDAILLRAGVNLFIESYGTIAGGGGGGGSGGYPIHGSSATQVGGLGGHGAGWDSTLGYISESDSDRNGINSSVNYGIHGGNGGLLGQLGIGAGGFVDDDASKSQTNPGTNYSQYARSGNGGEPGSAIKGYDASRVTFINSTESSVWGDSAFKFKA